MKYFMAVYIVLFTSISAWADGDALVIKTNGAYGIINKGKNQGIKEGLVFTVKRKTYDGIVEICRVKVIRTTPNRAAVEQISKKKSVTLKKGDALYSESDLNVVTMGRSSRKTGVKVNPKPAENSSRITPIENASAHVTPPQRKLPEQRPYILDSDKKGKQPWITLNTGTSIPNASFGASYSTSLVFGGSYMIPAGNGFNLGVEVNNNILGGSRVVIDPSGLSTKSSSLLEAHAVMQKFFGRSFFLELGGGLYRPKLRTLSIDNVESTYSSTNFGFFGGAGVFVATSPYAGITFKARLHSYFDRTTRQYYGLAGGFRFKLK